MKGARGLKLCGERLEEIQDLLGELSELLDDEDEGEDHGVSDQTMEALRRDLDALQDRIGDRGQSEETTDFVDQLEVTVKALGVVIMLLATGGALALSCWDGPAHEAVVDA